MFKNKIIKYVLKYLFIIIGVICIPWLSTLFWGVNITQKIYESSKSGKYIIVENEKYDVEEFVAYALMKQMDIKEEEEALKVQAIILRTYIYKSMLDSDLEEIEAKKLDLPYILPKELEKIWGDEFNNNYNKLMKIVANTAFAVLTYKDEIITPYFHSVSCGYTREGTKILGEEYGYLKSVSSSKDVNSDNYLLGIMVSKEEFASKIKNEFEEIAISNENPLESVQILERDDYGYVDLMQIGSKKITGDEFAKILELNSPNFQVEDYDGEIRIITKGLGHGLGLSMYGSVELAKEGKSYKEILSHYYSEVYLKVMWEE